MFVHTFPSIYSPIYKILRQNFIKLDKDKNEKWTNAEIVYKFNCKNCPANYINDTKCKLVAIINNTKESVVNNHKTSFSPNHEFDWQNVTILDHEFNWKKRLIFEMLHISSNKNSINKKEDIQNLISIYKSLFLCTTT